MSDGGYRPIETLKAGDSVLTLNERTQEVESDTVLSRFLTANSDLVKLTTSTGKSVVCSKTHTLLSEALCPEWVAVQNLTVGSKVVVVGGVDTLVDIQPYQAPEGTIVYILEMEKNHNFFAGDILCHNYIKKPQQYEQYDEVLETQI
jgi:intein/homing endonuclease